MSSFNNMDRVPVKIAESYKPPPRVYQMPQAIAHKIALPPGHYHEAPQYCYDFQLEHKVLAKIPEWRRMRQRDREARRERREKREEERLRVVEAQQKQLLGAVNYPSTEELSSSSESEDEERAQQAAVCTTTTTTTTQQLPEPQKSIVSAQTGSFHNILQPTILPSRGKNVNDTGNVMQRASGVQVFNSKPLSVGKDVYAFNYKDFEEDTSSPFDNIELKTINDLDILAQVLHNTQLKAREQEQKALEEIEKEKQETEVEQSEANIEQLETKANTHSAANSVKIVNANDGSIAEQVDNSNAGDHVHTIVDAVNLDVLENAKAALQRVDFDNLSLKAWQNENIPSITTTESSRNTQANSHNYIYHTPVTYAAPYTNPATQHAYMHYNQLYNDLMDQPQQQPPPQQQQYTNFSLQAGTYGNQNYLYASNCNGVASSSYYSPTHLPSMRYVGHNANNYLCPQSSINGIAQQQELLATSTNVQLSPTAVDTSELCSKSKSVPDILKELSEEVRNSELRRSRYYSYNSDEGKLAEQEEEVTPQQSPTKCVSKENADSLYYNKLTASAQRLAKNISSMGFPLERVAKIATMFGADDKKIVEHLIPLSELMDLGFDETKISEALMKFDNNKEKALEYLIS